MVFVYVVPEHQRQSILHNKIIPILAIIAVDVIYAFPSIQNIIDISDFLNTFGQFIDNAPLVALIIRLALGLAFQVIASIIFIVFAR